MNDPRGRRLSLRAAAIPDVRAIRICGVAQEFTLEAEANPDATGKKIRKFSMTAYTGGVMQVGFGHGVVVDLETMRVPSQARPILMDHSTQKIIGHTSAIEVSQKRIYVAGLISGVGESAQEVIALAANGFPWQASVGASIGKLEFTEAGESVKVNGQNFTGPVYVARNTTLEELSFVAIGADSNTSANVAAGANRGTKMNDLLKAWLTAKGIDAATVADAMIPILQAQYDHEHKKPEQKVPDDAEKREKDRIKAQRDADAFEAQRVADIRRITAGANIEIEVEIDGKKSKVDLVAHAIREGWSAKEVAREKEVADLRLARPATQISSDYVVSGRPPPTAEIIEAAFCRTRRLPNLDKQFKPEVLEAADRFYNGIGLHQAMMMIAVNNGYRAYAGQAITSGNLSEIMHYAMRSNYEMRANAGFSTMTLPGVLGNVANKELLAGYMQEDQQWRQIARVGSVSNFFAVTAYRINDNMEYEEVGPAGEIKHGNMTEESYTRQVRTYAKMFALTRQTLINGSDLSAFDDLRQRIGRGSSRQLNRLVWTKFLNNAGFFTTARGNYLAGATTNLGVDGVGLELGVNLFRNMKSPVVAPATVGEYLGGEPKILLVPSALAFAADRLYKLSNPNGEGPDSNVHVGLYRPVVVPQLGDSSYVGYSTTAWYLLRDPADRAAIVVSFLNGVEQPVVETSDADFNVLGVQWRGYSDVGADLAEWTAGVKIKGAA